MSQEALSSFRTRYPQYDDLSDQELAQKVIAKFPAYEKTLGDIALVPERPPGPPSRSQGAWASVPGIQPDAVQAPLRTEDPLTEFNKAFYGSLEWGAKSPTFAETYLPPGIVTKAATGLERGARLGLGALGAPFAGAGAVVEQAAEQAPRLVGEPPTSTPATRVARELPGLAYMPKGPTGVPGAPAPVAGGIRQKAVDVINKNLLRVTPESREVAQTARELDIPVTISEARNSPGWAKVERIAERYPLGGGFIRDLRESQRAGTEAAVGRVTPEISETPYSPATAGQTIKDVSRGEVQESRVAEMARAQERRLAESAAGQGEATSTVAELGPPTTVQGTTATTKATLKRAEDLARAEASRRYDEVETLAGDAPVVTLTQTGQRSQQILSEEQALKGLGKTALTRAAGAAEGAAGPGVPSQLQNLPREVIESLGLDRGEPITFKQARLLESRISGLLRTTTDDYVKRQLRSLRDAVRADVETFTQTAPGDLGVKLREANEFYRTRVAQPFGSDSAIRTLLDEVEPAKVEAMLFDKRGAERMLEIKAEMDRVDPTAWGHVRRRFGDRFIDGAMDPVTGTFSTERFAQAVAQYPPEVRRAILGDQAPGFNRLVDRYQEAARAPGAVPSPIQADAIFRAYAKAVPEDIVQGLGKLQPSELATLKAKLGPEVWKPIGGAWWDDVVKEKSMGKGGFSRALFLKQLKSTNPETLRELIGAQAYDDVEKLRGLLERQERVNPLGDNPSGTAQALVGSDQLWSLIPLAGSVFVGNVAGITQGLNIALTPTLVAQLLSHPQGIRLLTEGMQAPQGSKAAQDAAIRMGVYLGTKFQKPELEERVRGR